MQFMRIGAKFAHDQARKTSPPSSPSLAEWRQLENLAPNAPLHQIHRLQICSPYPVELTPDEFRLAFCLRRLFPPTQIFLDNYFTRSNEATTQIDCLAVNRSGIFVFESKGYSGWVFGSERNLKWTQILAYGNEKHYFFNPIRQNQQHIHHLQHFLPNDTQFYSVVVFPSDAELKKIECTSENTYVCRQIQVPAIIEQIQQQEIALSDAEVAQICAKIRRARFRTTEYERLRHVAKLPDELREEESEQTTRILKVSTPIF